MVQQEIFGKILCMNPQVLLEENINLRVQVTHLNQQLQQVKEQLEWLKRQVFGQRSEKIIENGNQLSLELQIEHELETKELQKQTVEAHQRRKRAKGQDKITLPDDIPVESKILDLSDKDKICPKTGTPLVKIGEEISRKIAHKPGSYYIKELIRPKYALPHNEGIAIAALPEGILPKSQADESFLAEVLTRKFGDHLPLYRIVEILSREKIIISKQLLSQWVLKCGGALSPLYNELEKQILQSPVLFTDETPIDMLMPGKGKTHQGYMWVKVAKSGYRLYHFKTNRKHENAEEIFQGYTGIVHSDKYGAYETLANKKQFIWCPCWAHIRRKFYEAESGDPKLRSYILRKIRYLFMLEKVAWSRTPKERLRIRQEKEVPIIDDLIQKAKQRLIEGKLLPKSKMREALGYFLGLGAYLKNYTEHSESRLDNNEAERAIRPLAIGRKNWLFVGSEAGGKAAAVLLSLVQSCRATGINPREYLEDVMRRLMDHNSQKLEELLPLAWAASKKTGASQPG